MPRKSIRNDGKKFSKEYQPSGEAKSKGKRKKRVLKDLAEALVSGEGLEKAKKTAAEVGLDLLDDEYSLEITMTLRQVEKALKKGDTSAFSAAMDRLRGKPKQISEISLSDGNEKGYLLKPIEEVKKKND